MAKLNFDDSGGVWRTVGGKHIFIKDGESLSSAMKKSGKFKTQSKKENNNSDVDKKKKLEELERKKEETIGFLQKGAIQEEIDMLKDDFKGTKEQYREYLSKERERRLNEYQKEKAERLKVKEQQEKETGERDYKMAHRPSETKITADNLTNQNVESPMPKDVYEHPEYYSSGNREWIDETIKQLNNVRNNPNGEVVIYRATTGDKINNGDWITLSKKYAEQHNDSQLDGKGKVIEMKVKAKDIQFAGDMLEEWGYYPTENGNNDNQITNTLKKKAYQKYLKEHPASKITFEDFKDMNKIK